MAKERIEMELACSPTCPFNRNCGLSYVEGETPCVDNINSVIKELKKSLQNDPILDPDEKDMKFSDPKLGGIIWNEEIPIYAELEIKLKNGAVRDLGIRLGEFSLGEILVYAYNNQVRDRIKDTGLIV